MIITSSYTHCDKKTASLLPSEWWVILPDLNKKAYKQLVTLKKSKCDYLFELNFMDNDQIQQINCSLRGKDAPTDVISVCAFENDTAYATLTKSSKSRSTSSHTTFGEIFISLPICMAQARELNQSMLEELKFLYIHGILHIFGYDHQTPEEESEMMGIAYKILERK